MSDIKWTPKKPVAPTWLAYVSTALYMYCTLAVVIGLMGRSVWFFVSALADMFIICFLAEFFAWDKSYTLSKRNGKYEIRVQDIVGMLGHDTSRYVIDELSEVKVGRGILRGSFTYYDPLSRKKSVSVVKVQNIPDKVLDILRTLESNVDKSQV